MSKEDLELELKTLQFKYDLLKKTHEGSLRLLAKSLVSKIDQLILAKKSLIKGWKKEEKLLLELKEALIELRVWKKKAYKQEPDNPYIIESIGWAYYLIKEYDKAENLLRKATHLMPDDPIVNDHYGDILWKLDRKIEANYFWKKVLTFEDTENEMKEEIYYKLLKGPKKI